MKAIYCCAIFLSMVGCSVASGKKIQSFALTPQEMESIQNKSEARITLEDLLYWDRIANEEIQKKYHLRNGHNHRLFAYLYQAQKAFAESSNGKGDIGPISAHVIGLFFPEFKNPRPSDPFSIELSARIVPKIDARFQFEKAHIHSKKITLFKDSWKGELPYFGTQLPTMQPWYLSSASEFRAPKPPAPEDPFWQKQLAEVKEEMAQATKQQVFYWDQADWKEIAQAYIKELPVMRQIKIRAKLACALMDSLIAVFDSKYAYLIRRPDQLDPTFIPLLPTPNHPSYPAAHSSMSGTAYAILTSFFPENQQEWEQLRKEAGLSRIEGGIHFPIDVQAGNQMGYEIGKKALSIDDR